MEKITNYLWEIWHGRKQLLESRVMWVKIQTHIIYAFFGIVLIVGSLCSSAGSPLYRVFNHLFSQWFSFLFLWSVIYAVTQVCKVVPSLYWQRRNWFVLVIALLCLVGSVGLGVYYQWIGFSAFFSIDAVLQTIGFSIFLMWFYLRLRIKGSEEQ
jgi:hypothetical protein